MIMLPSEAVFSLTHATSSSLPIPHAIPQSVAVFALSGTRAIVAPGTGSVAQTARDRNVGPPLASALSPREPRARRCCFSRGGRERKPRCRSFRREAGDVRSFVKREVWGSVACDDLHRLDPAQGWERGLVPGYG